MIGRWWLRARTEGRDLVELVLLPGVAALLPWPLAFRVLRRLTRWLRPYEQVSASAQAQAAARAWVGDARHWRLVRRLVTLVDHADLYIAHSRSDAWMERHLDVQGQWPAPNEPGIIFTFHWGAGMWGLRHARAAGLRAHALVAPLNSAQFEGRKVLHAYARARTAEVSETLGVPTLDTSVSLRPVLRALRAGEQVLAAIDVPSDQASTSEGIRVLGVPARVPRALLRLAIDQRVPVTVFLTGLDAASGRRSLRIHQLGVYSEVAQLAEAVFAFLDQAIRNDPPAWHLWAEADRFFMGP